VRLPNFGFRFWILDWKKGAINSNLLKDFKLPSALADGYAEKDLLALAEHWVRALYMRLPTVG
jgi:hypothetical protein